MSAATSAAATSPTTTEPALREVTDAEVTAYAKKGCKACRYSAVGIGKLRINVRDRNGNVSIRDQICPCTAEKFLRANPGVRQDTLAAKWYWPPETKKE